MVVGIDLGTTFSAIARVTNEGEAEIITNRDGERTTPSVVMFEEGSVVIGEQAKDNSITDPDEVCQFVKRQMGNKDFSFDASETQKYTAEDISAMILKRLKEDAEAYCSEKIDGAVITVPAYFDDAQRKATQDAGKIAGLNVIGTINEPTAAAIAYCHGHDDVDGNIMVYDLGGGTFDITIMKLSENLNKIDILATTGDRNLGGFDFDNVIMTKVMKEFQDKYQIDLEDDDEACQQLRIKAEATKKALSSRPKAMISIASQGKVLKTQVTREEFNEKIKGYLDRTKTFMEIAMEDAKLKWSDLSKIILVGGSTRIPAVQEMIKEATGIEPSHELNPDEAVALGAAYYADSRNSKENGTESKANRIIKVTDVNSHSLGVIATDPITKQDKVSFIIKRNTPLPAIGEDEYRTMYDNQKGIYIRVVEGEDEDPEDDRIIGTSELKMGTPRPKGSPIGVHMEYDEDGIVHVRVKDLVDNTDLGEMRITRDANLTDSDVSKKAKALTDIDVE